MLCRVRKQAMGKQSQHLVTTEKMTKNRFPFIDFCSLAQQRGMQKQNKTNKTNAVNDLESSQNKDSRTRSSKLYYCNINIVFP
jgi:hypothetical protein